MEKGEGDEAALARELREELSLEVEVGGFVAESLYHYEDLSVLLVAYRVHTEDPAPVADEHDALRWLSLADLREVDWAPADVSFLDHVEGLLAD